MKDQILTILERRSIHRLGYLAAEMIAAPSADKETVLAERDFHLWLAEICGECLQPAFDGPI